MGNLSEAETFQTGWAKKRLDVEIKPIIENKIERIFMNENLKTKAFLTKLFLVVKSLKAIFGDGFQISDALKIAGLLPELISLAMEVNGAMEEKDNLSLEQIKELTEEFTKEGISIFWVNNSLEDAKFGTENINALINYLAQIVKTAIEALRDGLNINDIAYVVPVVSNSMGVIQVSSKAFEEVKHLDALKIGSIVGQLLVQIFHFIKK